MKETESAIFSVRINADLLKVIDKFIEAKQLLDQPQDARKFSRSAFLLELIAKFSRGTDIWSIWFKQEAEDIRDGLMPKISQDLDGMRRLAKLAAGALPRHPAMAEQIKRDCRQLRFLIDEIEKSLECSPPIIKPTSVPKHGKTSAAKSSNAPDTAASDATT